ncbi:MAG: aminopeptidase P N-terminal domain-containing protein, partial [Gammaproteobacteria bacterium]|nr:aminopeptidase P N-terminal domain-containing protein [Gammaproteobacteria bacterium]
MLNKEFKLRRNNLLKHLANDSIAVIFAAKEHDKTFYYRQNSDFYYLTGFIEPEAIAVLVPNHSGGTFILFSRENDPTKEQWEGKYAGQTGACHDFGADKSFPISQADIILPRLLAKSNNIYSNIGYEGDFDSKIITWLNQTSHSTSTKRKKSPNLINLGEILHEMRVKKSEHEIIMLRKAAEITTKGHLRAMQKCHPNMYEFELEAELLHEFIRLGGRHTAFEPIVAGGVNACTLHYCKNNQKLVAGELVLIDAGAKYDHYSADVTRTFPVNGKFTKEQQTAYE